MFSLKKAKQLYYGFTTLFTIDFLIFLTTGMLGYVNSAFLGTFFQPETVTFIFALLAIFNVVFLALIPTLLRTFGVRALMAWIIPFTQAAILLYGLANHGTSAVLFFLLQGACLMLLTYFLDLYIETITKDESLTGNIRSLFLTAANIATILAPLAIIFLVIDNYYPPLFVIAALTLTPVLILSLTTLKKIDPAPPQKSSFIEALKSLSTCRHSVARVIGAHFILQMFFAWTTIYAPLYLITHGYSWQVIGSVFIFALIPYLVLEIPVGILADKYFGEVEMMVIGFIILGTSVALLSFIPISLIALWAVAFFFTRVGAALVEITTESYFFKQVNQTDSALVSLFRMLRSFGLLGGALIGLLFLPIVGFENIFYVFGVAILLGIPFALGIKDSR